MPTYITPPGIARELHAFDPALRLRWSDGQGCWRLERKVSRGTVWPPSTLESPAAFEDRTAAHDGYVLVDLIRPRDLSARLVPVLRQADIWSSGGADAVADAMDRLDVTQRETANRMMGEKWEAAARERFRYMNRVRTVSEKHAHTAPPGGMSVMGGV